MRHQKLLQVVTFGKSSDIALLGIWCLARELRWCGGVSNQRTEKVSLIAAGILGYRRLRWLGGRSWPDANLCNMTPLWASAESKLSNESWVAFWSRNSMRSCGSRSLGRIQRPGRPSTNNGANFTTSWRKQASLESFWRNLHTDTLTHRKRLLDRVQARRD